MCVCIDILSYMYPNGRDAALTEEELRPPPITLEAILRLQEGEEDLRDLDLKLKLAEQGIDQGHWNAETRLELVSNSDAVDT